MLYLGHLISKEGYKVNPSKIEAVQNIKQPKNLTQLRSLIGMFTFYRTYLKEFSSTAKSLYELLKKDVKFQWKEEHQKALDKLKNQMCSAPCLIFASINRPFILITDASDFAAGITLLHPKTPATENKPAQKGGVIAYHSKTFSPAIMNKSVHYRELYAICTAMRLYSHILTLAKEGIIIKTDRKSLVDIAKSGYQKKALDGNSSAIQRMILEVESYPKVEWVFIQGKVNPADYFSRMTPHTDTSVPTTKIQEALGLSESETNQSENARGDNHYPHTCLATQICTTNGVTNEAINEELPTDTDLTLNIRSWSSNLGSDIIPREDTVYEYVMTVEDLIINQELEHVLNTEFIDIARMQKDCKIIGHLYHFIKSGTPSSKLKHSEIMNHHKYSVDDNGILRFHYQIRKKHRLHKTEDNPKFLYLIVAPQNMRHLIIKESHEQTGHGTTERTFERTLLRFYWLFMWRDIHEYTKSCDVCQRSSRLLDKPPPLKNMDPFDGLSQNDNPLGACWSIDLVGPFISDSKQYKYMLTCVESLTKYPWAIPLRRITAEEICKHLHELYCIMGSPRRLRSDLGKQLIAGLIDCLNEMWSTKRYKTTSYKPSSNGIVEKFHKVLNNTMTKLVMKDHKNWSKHVPYALYGLRSSINKDTGVSPCLALFGKSAESPLEKLIDPDLKLEVSTVDRETIQTLQDSFRITREILLERIRDGQQKSKEYFDRKTKFQEFEIGQKVLLHTPVLEQDEVKKWTQYLRGPFIIHEKSDCGRFFKLKNNDTGEITDNVGIRRIKHYYDPETNDIRKTYSEAASQNPLIFHKKGQENESAISSEQNLTKTDIPIQNDSQKRANHLNTNQNKNIDMTENTIEPIEINPKQPTLSAREKRLIDRNNRKLGIY